MICPYLPLNKGYNHGNCTIMNLSQRGVYWCNFHPHWRPLGTSWRDQICRGIANSILLLHYFHDHLPIWQPSETLRGGLGVCIVSHVQDAWFNSCTIFADWWGNTTNKYSFRKQTISWTWSSYPLVFKTCIFGDMVFYPCRIHRIQYIPYCTCNTTNCPLNWILGVFANPSRQGVHTVQVHYCTVCTVAYYPPCSILS